MWKTIRMLFLAVAGRWHTFRKISYSCCLAEDKAQERISAKIEEDSEML
jgi:hypothetical protein